MKNTRKHQKRAVYDDLIKTFLDLDLDNATYNKKYLKYKQKYLDLLK